MNTNLNDAHQLLNENSTVYDNQLTGFENMCKFYSIAKQAVEIASKTDWFYPSKNELPKTGEMVYLALSNGSYKQQLFDEYDKTTVDYFKDEFYVKAWCYLPTL